MTTATIKKGESKFRLDGDSEAEELLYDALSYENPDRKFIDAYQKGHWDGIHRLFTKNGPKGYSAPVGLSNRAIDVLERNGYNVEVEDARPSTEEEIDTKWNFEHDLRDYQLRAIEGVADQQGGIVSLPTGAGKTVTALRIIHNVGKKAIIFVHTKELLYQWADRVRDILDVVPGLIGDGGWSENGVTIAMMQTVDSQGAEKLDDYYLSCFDEAHRTSAAQTFHDIGIAVNSWFRVGLSATPWRTVKGEEMKIEGAIGGKAHEVTAPELIEQGYLAEPEWEIVDPSVHGSVDTVDENASWQTQYQEHIVEGRVRNRAVAGESRSLAEDGYSVLVSVDRIEHGEILQSRIATDDCECVFLYGEHDSDYREDVLERFSNGEIDVLVSTLVREGVDIPSINAVVIAEGLKSDIQKIQTIGRALRPENGDHAKIVDFEDHGGSLGDHYRERFDAYVDYYGKYGPAGESDVAKVRKWLSDRGIPTEELEFSEVNGRVQWRVEGYINNFDHYMDVMKNSDEIQYAGNNTNAVEDVGVLE